MFMSTLVNMENLCTIEEQNIVRWALLVLKGLLLNIYFKLMIWLISLMKLKDDRFIMQYVETLRRVCYFLKASLNI